jgi:late competence protein required for DNA uptake (superfamily II DNA/RNA helicase)
MGWDKIFNCERCNKKLWTSYRKLPDGKIYCNECYTFYLMQLLDKINDNKAYDIIYNFVEKYQGKYPVDLLN